MKTRHERRDWITSGFKLMLLDPKRLKSLTGTFFRVNPPSGTLFFMSMYQL